MQRAQLRQHCLQLQLSWRRSLCPMLRHWCGQRTHACRLLHKPPRQLPLLAVAQGARHWLTQLLPRAQGSSGPAVRALSRQHRLPPRHQVQPQALQLGWTAHSTVPQDPRQLLQQTAAHRWQQQQQQQRMQSPAAHPTLSRKLQTTRHRQRWRQQPQQQGHRKKQRRHQRVPNSHAPMLQQRRQQQLAAAPTLAALGRQPHRASQGCAKTRLWLFSTAPQVCFASKPQGLCAYVQGLKRRAVQGGDKLLGSFDLRYFDSKSNVSNFPLHPHQIADSPLQARQKTAQAALGPSKQPSSRPLPHRQPEAVPGAAVLAAAAREPASPAAAQGPSQTAPTAVQDTTRSGAACWRRLQLQGRGAPGQ